MSERQSGEVVDSGWWIDKPTVSFSLSVPLFSHSNCVVTQVESYVWFSLYFAPLHITYHIWNFVLLAMRLWETKEEFEDFVRLRINVTTATSSDGDDVRDFALGILQCRFYTQQFKWFTGHILGTTYTFHLFGNLNR